MTTSSISLSNAFFRFQPAVASKGEQADAMSIVRFLLLAPAVCAWFVLFDVLQRIASAYGNEAFQQWLAAQWAEGLGAMLRLALDIRFEISPELRRHVATMRRSIIVANHQSPLDIIAMLLLRPAGAMRFVARAGLARGVPGVSAFLRRPGQVLLAKDDHERNLRALESLGRTVERNGDNAIIFPEGAKTSRNYRELRRFKASGLGAIRAGAPNASIVVLAIGGANEAWRGAGHLPRRGVTVRLDLAREIAPRAARALTDEALAAECERAVRGVLAEPRAA
jgi:1-acyl-sn-glycerol-3-phosphate acyltransferase